MPAARPGSIVKFTDKLQFALLDGPHAFPFPALEYYYIYPHLSEDAILIIDDNNIPIIYQQFEFLCAEKMFELLEVVRNTASFCRTAEPVFERYGDGWWLQEFNRPDRDRYGIVKQLECQRKQIDALRAQVEEMNASISFRLGMMATAPGRLLQQRARALGLFGGQREVSTKRPAG